MHIFGGISFLCSVSLILLYLTNKTLRYSINNEVIFYIAVCDMLSAAGAGIGLVDEGTIICQFQAIVTNIFPISGIYWTSILVYLMLGIVANEKVLKTISWKIHFVGWVFPTLITLLPLTTNRYGVAGDNHGWCFIDRLDSSPSWSTLFWMIVSFYAWIWTSEVFFALFLSYLIYILYMKKLSFPSGRLYLLPHSISTLSHLFSVGSYHVTMIYSLRYPIILSLAKISPPPRLPISLHCSKECSPSLFLSS
jgi:hypothetical protein